MGKELKQTYTIRIPAADRDTNRRSCRAPRNYTNHPYPVAHHPQVQIA